MNYYIQGDAAKADKIKAAFENKGYSDKGFTFDVNDILFFTANNKHINVCPANGWLANIIKTHPDYKELELPVESKFKVGDWITCVDDDGDTSTEMIEDFWGDKVRLIDCDGVFTLYPKSELKQYHLWSIADAKDGDVLATDNGWTCIFKAFDGCLFSSYCFMDSQKWFCEFGSEAHTLDSRINGNIHPATKEQRDLLFERMKEAGYQWDEKKKELRKIIEPKFKVGDDIETGYTIETIAEVDHTTRSYYCESGRTIYFANQDLWHLAPKPHYDIANFHAGMPVLVRDYDNSQWSYVQFSHLIAERNVGEGGFKFNACGIPYIQCIPFNDDTKHLLGTTDMCDEQYINW